MRRDIGDYDLDVFIGRLPYDMFPNELRCRFLDWCKAKLDYEEYLPVALLYWFLEIHLSSVHGYPSDAPPGMEVKMTITVPAQSTRSLNKGSFREELSCKFLDIIVINWKRTKRSELLHQLSSWVSKMELDDNCMLLYRVTSWNRAINDMVEGMAAQFNAERLLELGSGAYFAQDLEYALDWLGPYRNDAPGQSLIVFKVARTILDRIGCEVIDDEEE